MSVTSLETRAGRICTESPSMRGALAAGQRGADVVSGSIKLVLCGDVMTGRGMDQVLPHPGSPALRERYIRDAREYIKLAEVIDGPIVRPVAYAYSWGAALGELLSSTVDLRIVNLETSITTSDEFRPEKDIHYRMHPRNVGVLAAARIDCCCVANNHVLDFGRAGLRETLQTLRQAGIAPVGAGDRAVDAIAPAIANMPEGGRVLVFGMGTRSSGIPADWAAVETRSGVNLLPDLTEHTAGTVAVAIRKAKQPADIAVASIHWGANWGYAIPDEQVQFAHQLIDAGVDLIHGHSSHHPKACELYRDRLIVYGCGDFVDDYEGITGYEEFRTDLRLAYVIRLEQGSGRLLEARLVPFQLRRFRLNRASPADASWLCHHFNTLFAPFGTHVRMLPDNTLDLGW